MGNKLGLIDNIRWSLRESKQPRPYLILISSSIIIHILYVLNILLIVQARGSIHGQEVRRGGGVEGKEEDKDNKKMVMHLDHCVGH